MNHIAFSESAATEVGFHLDLAYSSNVFGAQISSTTTFERELLLVSKKSREQRQLSTSTLGLNPAWFKGIGKLGAIERKLEWLSSGTRPETAISRRPARLTLLSKPGACD